MKIKTTLEKVRKGLHEPDKEYLRIATKVRLYPAFQIAIITGMRRGEILGLRWKDVDLERVLYLSGKRSAKTEKFSR